MTIVTNNAIAPDTVISFVLCNCKGNIFLLVFVSVALHISGSIHHMTMIFGSCV